MFTVRFVYEERDYNLNILRIAREHCLPQKKHEKKEETCFCFLQMGIMNIIPIR